MRFACALLLVTGLAGAQEIRGIYGGLPERPLDELGLNAVFLNERAINADRVALVKKQGARIFAEFNTLHVAAYLKKRPDAAPVGEDGEVCPPPQGWQGICPTHTEYRRFRMKAFEALLKAHELDGVWLDYHHAHASWERAKPELPRTCFCKRCVLQFQRETGRSVPVDSLKHAAQVILEKHEDTWVRWRCGVFTDWVKEFKAIRDRVRPGALLGSFHCPWSEDDHDGALEKRLAIDLRAQSRYLDVFSPMPYHARFGHANDPAWIARQTKWLGKHLGARARIWPIVQVADWGEVVTIEQVPQVIALGAKPPSTGVIVFRWNPIKNDAERIAAMAKAMNALAKRR